MTRLKLLICILVSIIPLFYLAIAWRGLPAQVPVHFNAAGEPDGYSSKALLWVLNSGLSALTIGLYLLLHNLHVIDPKRRGKTQSESFSRLADGLVLFLTAINLTALMASSGRSLPMTRTIYPLTGLLFAFLGNMMYSLKPNYFAGIRLPWTLADDGNWRATHRIAGVVWFLCGIALTAGSFLLGPKQVPFLLSVLLVPMIGIPAAYSFWYYKRSPQGR